MSVSSRRLLLVHAHPDDETLTTGGTIARYAAAGVEVTVLTCTLGEEGEVIGSRWAGLVSAQADQLGGYRITELSRALAALGRSGGPRFLGGAGCWRDSGMAGSTAAGHPRSFVSAGPAAVRELVAVIRELRPQVVITYDPAGSYGHPDHVHVHRVSTEAVQFAGRAQVYPETGPVWEVAKLYWAVTERSALHAGLAALGQLPAGWRRPEEDELPSVADGDVHAVIDVRHVLAAKLSALRSHTTQVTVAPGAQAYALSNNVAQPILAAEHYVLAHGRAGARQRDGREHDLFAGIEA